MSYIRDVMRKNPRYPTWTKRKRWWRNLLRRYGLETRAMKMERWWLTSLVNAPEFSFGGTYR